MEQEPVVSNVTEVPNTVQTPVVFEAKATASAEVAVAVNVTFEPNVALPGFANVIVCVAGFTVKICVTGVAAEKFALPTWLAAMEHEPVMSKVTDVPATVQTPIVLEANATAKPDVAVAVSVTAEPREARPGFANVIVCAAGFTVKICVIGAAAE